MNIDSSSQSSHTLDDVWNLLQEQSARIEHLETTFAPLPAAQDRAAIGRPSVIGGRKRRRPAAYRLQHPARSTIVPPAEVFAELAPITSDYATVPLVDGFNWADCAIQLGEGEWYLVAFRSVHRGSADDITLEMHDYGAYIEAQRRAIGLVFYFRGTPNERRECLSFCIWSSREEAVRAARLPLHRVAMTITEEKFESYTLERYILRKIRGQSGIELEPLTGDVPQSVDSQQVRARAEDRV